MTNFISKKIIITGTVQGVGYRSWLQKICNDKGVVGWVTNKKNVYQNLEIVKKKIAIKFLFFVNQKHSNKIIVLKK